MRKIVVVQFVTLDGVVQAGGNAAEDTSGGFKYGGWAAPYLDAGTAGDKFMENHRPSADLLLGRKTYELFASFWPEHESMWRGVNDVTKYVVSHNPTELTWHRSELITGDVVARIKELKKSEGSDLQVHGSSDMAQTLFKHDLVDELFLVTLPLTLGTGKRLFGKGTVPAAFELTDGWFAPNGVAMAYYKRAGEIKIGNAAS